MRILECVAISFSRGSSHLPNPGIEAGSPALQADALTSEPPGKTRKVGGGVRKDHLLLVDIRLISLVPPFVLSRRVSDPMNSN